MGKCRDMFEEKRLARLERKNQFRSYSQADLHKNDKISISQLLKENRRFPGLEVDSYFSIIDQEKLNYSKNEVKMEHLKQNMCKREDFNIFEVYRMYFDTESKGEITQQNFDTAMKNFGISKTVDLKNNLKYSNF